MTSLKEEIEGVLQGRGRKVLYAWTLQRIQGYCGDKDELAAELVCESVHRVLAGKRTWNRDTTPDPIDFLLSVIKSLISALRKKHPEQFQPSLSPEDAEVFGLLSPRVQRIEETIDLESIVTEILGELQGDDLLTSVFERIVFEGEEPSVLARELRIPVSEIYAARKRLDRKIRLVAGRREKSAV